MNRIVGVRPPFLAFFIVLFVLAFLASTASPAEEAGWSRARQCLTGITGDTVVPPGGLGSPSRLRLERAGQILLLDQDFRILPGDSSLILAAPLQSADTLCLDKARSPLLPDPRIRLYRLEDIPVWREGVLDSSSPSASNAAAAAGLPGTATSPFATPDSAGTYRLNYSGSKSMAVTMGSGGGLGLDAALFINLEGQVAENVFVEGQLSDQNVPVQPEGNTATLKEVDTKFMRIYGRGYSYVLGNYLLAHGVDGEDAYRAKVQGMELALSRGQYALKAQWSVAEGQYASDTLRGVDGKQRGYYLRGRDGRQYITVLAGTERIWRNGTPLRRGTDYTIDYSEGRLDFLNAFVVTSENLFSAEFQYTDQEYGRSLAAGTVADTGGAFSWSLRAITEKEDENHPLAFAFDAARKARFSAAGDSLVNDSLGRPLPMPASQSLMAGQAGWRGAGHESRATALFSALDRNLYSSRDDGDNLGVSTRYRGSQELGRPFDQGGFGKTGVRLDHEYRSGDYQSFKQLVETRGFVETWNLDAAVGERDFLAHRLRIEERPFTRILIGAEAGRAESLGDRGLRPGDSLAPPTVDALSRRGSVFSRLGGEKTFLEASTEAKLAKDPDRRDNYRQAGRIQVEAAGLTPSFSFVRNEWLTARLPGGGLARSLKQEPEASLATRPLLGYFAFTSTTSLLSQRSDFDGRLAAVEDSVRDWGFSQKAEVLALGPWTADVFYSYRNHREWRLDAASTRAPDPVESDFNQVEWNNQVADHRKGYGLVSNYRVSQTAELPLVEHFEKVQGGCGNYVYDPVQNAYHEVETCGDFALVGLRRDTTLASAPYQDLAWTANLELSPGRWPFAVRGVLKDLELVLDMAFDHQDTTGDAELLPLFTDAAIEAVRSGRSRFSPSLEWKDPAGDKSAQLRIDRVYARSAGFYAHREKRFDEKTDFRHEIGEAWEYALEQGFESRQRTSLSSPSASAERDESETWTFGSRLLRRLPRDYALEGRARFERIQGNTPTGELDLQGLLPAIKVEKSSLYSGRAFLEYGLIGYWGRGEPSYYSTEGYRRGLTHRLEANAHFQTGEHMHLNFDYVVRLEPGSSRPSQKLTAEARAVF